MSWVERYQNFRKSQNFSSWQEERKAMKQWEEQNPCQLDSWVNPTYFVMGKDGKPCGKLFFNGSNGQIQYIQIDGNPEIRNDNGGKLK